MAIYSGAVARALTVLAAWASALLPMSVSAGSFPAVPNLTPPASATPARGSSGAAWVPPLTPLDIARPFDPPARDWLPGHRGVDVAAAPGAGVVSPAGGTVTFAGPVAGRGVLVVTHDDGLRSSFEPVTASVAVGTRVGAGTVIATLDATAGHCESATCLHWGVRRGETYLDPLWLLDLAPPIVLLPLEVDPPVATHPARRAGGPAYTNGRVPRSALCGVSFAPGVGLRCDAARGLESLNGAFRAVFGHDLAVTDSYRSYAAQVRTKTAKGALAARPGTSQHGWGLAVDLGGGLTSYSSAPYRWMLANAPRYGWDNPGWARAGGTKNEPWHWEFTGA